MKHIDDIKDYIEKTYPYKEYKVGDFVKLYSDSIGNGEIVGIGIDEENNNPIYTIQILFGNKLITMSFLFENIKRLLTKEEIDDYKMKLATKKYNL